MTQTKNITKKDTGIICEIKKKIKIFTDLGLDIVDYIPSAENYESHTEELEELNIKKGGSADQYSKYKY